MAVNILQVALVAVYFTKIIKRRYIELLDQCGVFREDLLSCLAVFLVLYLQAALSLGLLCSGADGLVLDLCKHIKRL